MWCRDAVVYQVYPRSFQDSDGDGVGDLPGITRRLDHLAYLGVDALWLSPIYPSPLADFGYDVADYTAVDPVFGTLDDFDSLVAAAHQRGLHVLLDLVPSHTSIEHPWFREHPDWYIWSPVDGPPNNWVTAFGGSARNPSRRLGATTMKMMSNTSITSTMGVTFGAACTGERMMRAPDSWSSRMHCHC